MTEAGTGRSEVLQRRLTWLTLIAIGLFLVASVTTAFNRPPWSDEGWFADPSYNFARHGNLDTTNLEPIYANLTRIEQHTYWVMPLFLLGQGFWYKVVPPTVVGTRLFTMFWALAALGAFFLVLRNLVPGRRGVVLTGVLLLATDYIFINNSAFARPDMMCFSLGLMGIAAYVQLRTRNLALALAVGNAFVAASGLTHPNGVLHFAGLWLLVFWLDRHQLRFQHLAMAAIPYLVFGCGYAWYIWQDVDAFRDQMLANGKNNGRMALSWNPFVLVMREFTERYVRTFGIDTGGITRLKVLVLLTYLAAAGFVALHRKLRREQGVLPLVALLVLYFAIQCVFNQKLDYYLIHIVWIYVALLALALEWLWRNQKRTRPWIAAWVLILVLVQTGGIFLKARLRSYQVAEMAAFQYIRQNYPHARLIFGSEANIFNLHFSPALLDDPYLGVSSGKWADVIIVETIYRNYFDGWKINRPEDAKKIAERLSHYRLLYDHAGYQIYGLASSSG